MDLYTSHTKIERWFMHSSSELHSTYFLVVKTQATINRTESHHLPTYQYDTVISYGWYQMAMVELRWPARLSSAQVWESSSALYEGTLVVECVRSGRRQTPTSTAIYTWVHQPLRQTISHSHIPWFVCKQVDFSGSSFPI